MTQHHVDLPHAKSLQEAGWDKKTERVFSYCPDLGYQSDWYMFAADNPDPHPLIWQPNVMELLDVVTYDDLQLYRWFGPATHEYFPEWLYHTIKDPNTLADVWVWGKEGKK